MPDVASLLPPNAPAGDRAIERATARLGAIPLELSRLWDPETCPVELLPWLGWGLSIDIWDRDWTEAQRRRHVAEAIERQRRKGSVRAVREVLEAFDAGLSLREWFAVTPNLPPHTFEVWLPVVEGPASTAAFVEKVADQVVRVKPVRSWFTIAQVLAADGVVGVLGVGRAAAASRHAGEMIIEDASADWADVLLTEYGEPLFTEADTRLEID